MTTYIDTHCHLEMLQVPVLQAIEDAQSAHVNSCVTIGTDPKSLSQVLQMVQEHSSVYGALGIHPHHANEYHQTIEEQIRVSVNQSQKIVAIGEIGLDYHYLNSDKELQKQAFEAQLSLARELGLPVVLHSRDAEEDTLAILKAYTDVRGVAHSFTGSAEMAIQLVERGWYIGVNGIVTFKNAQAVREMVLQVPLENLLLETDAPYLSPVPFRGKPNVPQYIPYIAEFLATLYGVSLERLAQQTTCNAQRLFCLPC